MTAVFLKRLSGGSLIDWCQKWSAAIYWTRRGGRTDFYHQILAISLIFLNMPVYIYKSQESTMTQRELPMSLKLRQNVLR